MKIVSLLRLCEVSMEEKQYHVKKNDTVVTTGKDNKTGKVLRIARKRIDLSLKR